MQLGIPNPAEKAKRIEVARATGSRGKLKKSKAIGETTPSSDQNMKSRLLPILFAKNGPMTKLAIKEPK
jgi:hypothetical protein